MSDPLKMVSAPHDPRGRLISIFVGAVLLPTVALSYVSIDLVPKLARETKLSQIKRAEKVLYYIERDLGLKGQTRALEAARVLGTDVLLDGRADVIAARLKEAGIGDDVFENLHFEAAPARLEGRDASRAPRIDLDLPRAVLRELELRSGATDEEQAFWPGERGETPGVLRYRFAPGYVKGTLIREYFEHEFSNPDQSLVVRVTDARGNVVYETAPTPDGRSFEVKRELQSPSFGGLSLELRYRERTIEQDVRRWETGTLALIAFIDLMLGAGLYMVYSNVRREVHLSRLKSDFVANVSHELKTPLALIRLFAETLELGRVANEEKKRQYYRVINQESQRLTQLINNILDFSRIEAGRKEYRFAPTDLAQVVAEVVEAYRFQIEQQGFALEVDVAEGLPRVEADKEALGQALINLLNNAIKYSREDKAIRVQVRQQGDHVQIVVADHGIGVAKGEQKKIFEKFYRGEDSLVHETKGSGLGLSLVRHIMEAHGGTVEVESVAGRGSAFTLSLPLAIKR